MEISTKIDNQLEKASNLLGQLLIARNTQNINQETHEKIYILEDALCKIQKYKNHKFFNLELEIIIFAKKIRCYKHFKMFFKVN